MLEVFLPELLSTVAASSDGAVEVCPGVELLTPLLALLAATTK